MWSSLLQLNTAAADVKTPAGALLDAIAGCTLLNGTPCSGDPADAALAEEAVQCRLMLDSSLAHLEEGGSSLPSGFMESMLVPGSQVRLCWLDHCKESGWSQDGLSEVRPCCPQFIPQAARGQHSEVRLCWPEFGGCLECWGSMVRGEALLA